MSKKDKSSARQEKRKEKGRVLSGRSAFCGEGCGASKSMGCMPYTNLRYF